MTHIAGLSHLNLLLQELAEELDVPASKYEAAKEHYEAVGEWLGQDDSELAPLEPVIYPQGSFALGTAVRPLGNDDYDIDAVCLLLLSPDQVSQSGLKGMVGRRLKDPKSRYRNMIEPEEGGRRCWTIKYADSSGFHLDVLPAIPDDWGWLVALGVPEAWAMHAICLTDRQTWDHGPWPRSNPRGYIEWFKDRMRPQLEEAKSILARQLRAEVEEIEDFRVRTPLQRVIQLLKRHRDIRYNGDDDKPISIIITTLAAQAYEGERNLGEALLSIVPRMRDKILKREGLWWIPNPVNPRENFADKWNENDRKARIFLEWLNAVEQEHGELAKANNPGVTTRYLANSYGAHEAHVATSRYLASPSEATGLGAGPMVLVPRKSGAAAHPTVEVPSHPGKPWGLG